MDMKQKLMALLMLIGVIFMLVLAPILGVALARTPIYQSPVEGQSQNETGDDKTQEAFSTSFTLEYNQRAIIKPSVTNYQNISIRLIIVSKATFDKYYASNTTITAENGLRLIYGNPQYADTNPTGWTIDAQFVAVAYSGTSSTVIEFMGSSNGAEQLISIPGTYYIIVQGANDDPGTSWIANEIVTFDINVQLQGPGKTISAIFVLIGFILLIIPFVAWAVLYIKDFTGGRR